MVTEFLKYVSQMEFSPPFQSFWRKQKISRKANHKDNTSPWLGTSFPHSQGALYRTGFTDLRDCLVPYDPPSASPSFTKILLQRSCYICLCGLPCSRSPPSRKLNRENIPSCMDWSMVNPNHYVFTCIADVSGLGQDIPWAHNQSSS